MTDMIEKAISFGLKEIMFTDHMDIDFPDKNMPFNLFYPDYSDAVNLYKVCLLYTSITAVDFRNIENE